MSSSEERSHSNAMRLVSSLGLSSGSSRLQFGSNINNNKARWVRVDDGFRVSDITNEARLAIRALGIPTQRRGHSVVEWRGNVYLHGGFDT